MDSVFVPLESEFSSIRCNASFGILGHIGIPTCFETHSESPICNQSTTKQIEPLVWINSNGQHPENIQPHKCSS